MRGLLGAIALCLALPGCSEEAAQRADEQVGALGGGALARVGGETVAASFVREVARRRGLELRRARDLVVVDALFAQEARERLAGSGVVKVVERGIWADALLAQLRAQAAARGAATAAELNQLRREHWQRLDRPVSVATVHAVALVKQPEQEERARQLAEAIREATLGLEDPRAFARAAEKVPADGIERRVESLPHVTPDGRVVQFDPGVPVSSGGFDPVFAKAAHAIAREGERSPVVKTRFGYHVILLVERVDAQRYSDDELRRQFSVEVIDQRAKRALETLTKELKARANVERSRNLEQLTARIWGQQ